MIYTNPSFKVFGLTAFFFFFLAALVQNTCAQYNNFDEDMYNCPNEALVYYKDCKGALQQCSNCLGDAERKCSAAFKEQGKRESICYDCTAQVSGNCDGIKPMCFGNQECHGANEKCLDYVCTFVPS